MYGLGRSITICVLFTKHSKAYILRLTVRVGCLHSFTAILQFSHISDGTVTSKYDATLAQALIEFQKILFGTNIQRSANFFISYSCK